MRPFKFTRYFVVDQGQLAEEFNKHKSKFVEIFSKLEPFGIDGFHFTAGGMRALIHAYRGEPTLDHEHFYRRYRITNYLGTDCYIVKFKLPKEDSPFMSFFRSVFEHDQLFGRMKYIVSAMDTDHTWFDVQYLYANGDIIPVIAAYDHFVDSTPTFETSLANFKMVEVPGYVISDVFQTRNPDYTIREQIEMGLAQAEYDNDWIVYQILTNMFEDYATNHEAWDKAKRVAHQNKFSTLFDIAKRAGMPVERLVQ